MSKKMIPQQNEHPYIRIFALLLLTALALVGITALTWCEEGDCNCTCGGQSCSTSKTNVGSPKAVQSYLWGGPDNILRTRPGDPAHISLQGRATGANPGSLDLHYTPPKGAADVTFEGRQPDERLPDGSYVFKNMAVQEGVLGWDTETIKVAYNIPSPPAGEDQMIAVDSVTVKKPNGEQDSASMSYPIESHSGASSGPVETTPSVGMPTADTEQQAANYYLWQIGTWHPLENVRLTTEVCQEWLDSLLNASVFIGVRFPLLGVTVPYTGSYSLPVAMRGDYFPVVKLTTTTYPATTLLSVPLEYKPKYHSFLSTALPWKDNERWFALGVKEGDITCPASLDIAPGQWEITTEAWLDFGGAENACAECVLPVYYCYEGQTLPDLPVAIPAQALSGVGAAYQGWGVTCAGPQLLRIADENAGSPPFFLDGMGAATVLATERVTFTHTAARFVGGTVNVTLSATSTLGGAWVFYTDANPPVPITQPVLLNGSSSTAWYKKFLVAGEIPAGAQPGSHTLYVTATNAANASQKTLATDILWVGDWTAPGPFKVYLPMVMRR